MAGTALIVLMAACASGRDNETGTDETMRGDTTNTQMNRDTMITDGMDRMDPDTTMDGMDHDTTGM